MNSEEPGFSSNLPNYQNQINQSPFDISHSQSINTIPSIRDYVISEDLLAGQRQGDRMSNVRRFFCLFVTFDFLFISLMWLICVMLKGQNIMNALSEQILHYNVHTSLFDIVFAAFARFSVLILFYACVQINHWIVISVSTALSCAFLITKVFMYNWPKSSQPVFEVLLVLASFILSWGEAWFLDFKVIPQEDHANRYLITATESERVPIIRSYVQGLPSMYTESIGNFYSPMATPEGSLLERDVDLPAIIPVLLTPEQVNEYKHLGARTLQTAWDLYQKQDWKLEKQQNQDLVFVRKDAVVGTIFKLETEINVSPRYLLDELYFGVTNLTKWNSSIKESHKVQAIDEYTDITYQISADGAGGLVSSRDFVNLRHWAHIEETYVLASVKCDHPRLPPGSKYTRAENGAGGYIFKNIPEDENKCRFIWIVNPNLKMKVPKFILDKEIIKMMFMFARDLKEYLDRRREGK
ncbi:steroidogenic acute regulatory protein-like isoform X1 [Euwallacea fornicatus]|uniref:steroidogenic acute regulatory protein-like isoform X1 n=4 Tax=Euwallacea fornicatus TaxID=995702 RepID=UPI00338D4763